MVENIYIKREKMSNIKNSLFIRSINKQPIERTPVWIMRQAGRYLPEYRATRAQAGSFLQLCKNKELACEVTLQPLRRFELDAAILFSDILTIPDAMDLGLSFMEGEGPKFAKPLRNRQSIENLIIPSPQDELRYVMDAASLIRAQMPVDLPLIGFAGSPWTLACYMIEGGSSKDFSHAINLLYCDPEAMHVLLNKLATAVTMYLDAQVKAGVNVLMLFDTWGGILTSAAYAEFSLSYMRQIIQHLKKSHPHIPVILFTKGGGQWLNAQVETQCDVIGIDWTCDLATARASVGQKVALQGNLDPRILLTNPECIQQNVRQVLAAYGQGSGHIFNLGHGITPDVPPQHVQAMLDAVRKYSPEYHVI
jgi:uroporphyrinogen decarboxylase